MKKGIIVIGKKVIDSEEALCQHIDEETRRLNAISAESRRGKPASRYMDLPSEKKEALRAKGRDYYNKNKDSILVKAKERRAKETPSQKTENKRYRMAYNAEAKLGLPPRRQRKNMNTDWQKIKDAQAEAEQAAQLLRQKVEEKKEAFIRTQTFTGYELLNIRDEMNDGDHKSPQDIKWLNFFLERIIEGRE